MAEARAPAAHSSDLLMGFMAQKTESLPQAGCSQRPLSALGEESYA